MYRTFLGPNEERFVCGVFACNHPREMPDLEFNTAQIGRFLVAGWVLKRLLHPPVVPNEEPIQRFLGETDAFVRLLKVLGFDTIVVD